MRSLILKEQSITIGHFIFLLKMRQFEVSSPKKQKKIQENFVGEKSLNKKKYRTCLIYLQRDLKSLNPFSLRSSVAALSYYKKNRQHCLK